MTDVALSESIEPAAHRPNLDKGFNPLTMILFGGILAGGLLFVAYSLYTDVDATGEKVTSYVPFILLFVALLIALGFEFVDGFHDTANAVATVIYTHALPAEFAVIWSGFFNFLGVALSTGAVAFGIISLLPVELILQVGSSAGFAMVFALLIAAILWNSRSLRSGSMRNPVSRRSMSVNKPPLIPILRWMRQTETSIPSASSASRQASTC
jgi:inorganic phosphate transporter, PiT family